MKESEEGLAQKKNHPNLAGAKKYNLGLLGEERQGCER